MAYKISYKVAAEQAEQLKNIAKDMDNYVNQVNQIVGKLGNDELLQSVRNDLNKFKKQLEEEKTILNLASSVISDVIQSFSGVEKKSVGKVDKAKAHNRDFYKRPVAVASAGAGAGAAAASHVSVSSGGGSSVVQQQQNISHSTTNFNFSGTSGASAGGFSSAGAGVSAEPIHTGSSGILDSIASTGAGVVSGEGLAAAGILAAGAAVAGVAIMADVKKEEKNEDKKEEE